MDRGDKVTESLWFLYGLEKQAEKSGGKVHTLLGNHELLVMHGDLSYLHPKYRYTSGISQTLYPDLFNEHSILGKWLRSKNITTVINDVGFVHGGFSLNVLEKETSLQKINTIFKHTILPNPSTEIPYDPSQLVSLLYFENGPLWYRGYANPKGFDEETANTILSLLELKNIVVGHTSMPKIVPILDDKIILIDSSIKFGKTGEILIYEQDSLYRGLLNGNKIAIDIPSNEQGAQSPFEYLCELEDTVLTIVLDTDLGNLMGENRLEEEYQKATMVALYNLEFNRKWDVRIKTRGNMRKQVCSLPPIKIDFPKRTLDYLGFTANDKLKLVLPCDGGAIAQQGLYKEYLVYQLYQTIDSMSYKTQLVNVILEDEGEQKYDLVGFFIEDEEDFEDRTQSKVIKDGIIRSSSIERNSYLKMIFFQYLILNNDFSIDTRHNLRVYAIPGQSQLSVTAYDFDYAGMVNQSYAVPHHSMPISNVRQPYFRGKKVTLEEVSLMRDFFGPKRAELEAIIQNAVYLSEKNKRSMLGDIDRFYKTLEREKQWRKKFCE